MYLYISAVIDLRRGALADGAMRQVQAPAMSIPTEAQFFSREDPSKPDIAFLKNHFYREGRLSEEQAMYILEKGTEILHHEPNVLSVDAPITGTVLFLPSLLPLRGRCIHISSY